ncbi:unnamed protein product [Onchocerca flexuosa]|uniref:E3 ubiquitin-protein ligase n=1 Tax=Onchocerca flexuosa TaxID=387005 RepID=A0A183HMJ6_9BILA|nr:unnamed protein product [Onchocerca flexuosa]
MINLRGKRALLMEMPLRVFVLCSQSQAQMWRRNGFSLVNQIHNYSAPTCRSEMFDRDVLMLQVFKIFLIFEDIRISKSKLKILEISTSRCSTDRSMVLFYFHYAGYLFIILFIYLFIDFFRN